MALTAQQRRKLRISLRLIAFGISAGLFFVLLSDGVGDWYPLVNGAIIGFLIAVLTSVFELNIYENIIRKRPFIFVFIIRTMFYLIMILTIIVLEIGIARMLKEDLDIAGLLENESFRNYIFGGEFIVSVFYTLALVVIINFTRLMSRKLGHGVLTSFITGKYHHPVTQEKIFMFLNIPSTHVIIDLIGRLNFHRFINDIVFDVTLPILSNYGIIYHYVEDEMVVTWKMNDGMKNAHAVRCYFDIKDKLHEHKEKYLKKYGISPVFHAALHCGEVVKGEIGFIKSEIVYHGDVMNTTSRILGTCSKTENSLLVSSSIMELLELPAIYRARKCGDIKLKGKKEPMQLYTIEEIDLKEMAFG